MKTIVRWFRIVLAAMIMTGLASGITAAVAATHTVEIKDLQFHPQDLTIKAGDTVVWKNLDAVAHTVTATGKFNSYAIDSNRSWKRTFRKAGIINYVCSIHSTMHGKLHIEN